MTFGKLVQRFFLDVGIAVAVLAVFAAAIVLSKGARVSGAWMALVAFTSGLFWVIVKQSRAYWRRPGFCLAIAGMLVVHLLAFIPILRIYPQWRGIWFVPIMIAEAGLFGAILYLLFGEREYR